jgi:hypothetical protein
MGRSDVTLSTGRWGCDAPSSDRQRRELIVRVSLTVNIRYVVRRKENDKECIA